MGLEVLFSIMYPRHHLIGLNHQALVHCQQTRLVYVGFNELCKPVEERGEERQPETIARSSQKSVLDWLNKDILLFGFGRKCCCHGKTTPLIP
ncbi:hypothetical protein F4823DRAFT_608604 [Ustulina deusta]|nr:hypothetical protein F4823DRAFT_608604 [Ustulina deusta]